MLRAAFRSACSAKPHDRQWRALAHEPLIDDETFTRVQTLIASAGRRPDGVRKPRASKRNYVLSGILRCGICQRRMIGSFNNDRNHYRCTYAAEYADTNCIAP
jgi:hypothetical protein